ncbi:hypothetical protein [Hydrogenivirga sp.]
MAQGATPDKGELFIKRAKQLNLAFIVSISVFFFVSLGLYSFFSMPVSARLVLYVYGAEVFSALIAYLVAFFVRRKLFPVSMSDTYWSYTAVRRYFWSYVLLCIPFGIAFLFFLFAGNFSALLLGYLLSLCGLILFRPRRGDVI